MKNNDRYWDCLDQAMEASHGGRTEEALAWLDQALLAHPEGAEAHNGRGEILWDEGKIEEALHEFERSLQADPKFVTAHLNRAELVVEDLSEFDQAVQLCDELLAGKPDLPRLDRATEAEVHYLKAKAVFYLDDLEGALFLVRRALKTGGDVSIYRAFEGQILFELGRFADARRALDAAIALDPESGHAIYHMGLVLERLGSGEEAQRAFAKANALDPERYPVPTAVDEEFFKQAAAEAIDNLPRSIREYVEDVPVLVEDYPSEELIAAESISPQILGLYVGVPKTQAEGSAQPQDLTRVILFKSNLEKVCSSRDDLVEQIQVTVRHEIGHHLGLSEEDLERLGLRRKTDSEESGTLPVMSGLVDRLRGIVGADACLVRPEELLVYECDGLTLHRAQPAAVVLPRSRDEVCRVVRACREHGVPFVPRGAGTGLSGGAVAQGGGVVIECSRMDRILAVDPVDRFAVVEPGVVNADLSKAAAPHGLFYAPDPSSQLVCTIGGNVAENSGGPHTLKYGTTTQHVLGLELVLPDGEVARLGSRSGFGSGYDLVGAVVGSEGTLGIVTEATVRLEPIPEKVETLLAIFPDVVSACRAVGGVIEAGLVPAALEIVDQRTIAAVEASVYAAGLPLDAGAVLLVELDGPACALPAQVLRIREIAAASGASRVEVARDTAERQRFWRARKGAFGAMGRLAPDLYVHDAVVPRPRLPEVLARILAIGDRHGLRLSNVFHAGDGNLHPNISFDRRDPDELARVMAAGAEILEACVAAGGVITGEHGIGSEKRDFMGLVFGEADLDAMKRLRASFDPDGVCNPEKIFPSTRFCAESNPKARGYERVPFDA